MNFKIPFKTLTLSQNNLYLATFLLLITIRQTYRHSSFQQQTDHLNIWCKWLTLTHVILNIEEMTYDKVDTCYQNINVVHIISGS